MDSVRSLILVFAALLQGCGGKGDDPASAGKQDVDRGNSATDDSGGDPVVEDSGTSEPDSGDGGAPADPSDSIGDSLESASDLRELESWNWDVPLASDAMDHEGDRDVYKMVLPVGATVFLAVHVHRRVRLRPFQMFSNQRQLHQQKKQERSAPIAELDAIWKYLPEMERS